MKITQCHVSQSLRLFADGFRSRWNLTEYIDTSAPCIFVGAYGTDIDIIKAHKGFKLIMFCGSDISNSGRLQNDADGFLSDMEIYKDKIFKAGKKYLTVPIKSFELFTPQTLGDKIYFYARDNSDAAKAHFNYALLEKLISHYGEDKFIIGRQGNSMQEVYENYYKKCFINLQFNESAGFTSVLELAHMGRVTVSNYPAPFCIPYKSIEDIFEAIDFFENYKDANQIHHVNFMAKDYLQLTSEWIYTDYWK